MPPTASILGETLPLRLSPTFLERCACPRCLRLTYIDRALSRIIRPSALRGSASHLAIADLTNTALKNREAIAELPTDEVRAAIERSTPREIEREITRIVNWVTLWRDRFQLRPKHLVGFEEKMAIDDAYQETTWDEGAYRGIVDVIHIIANTAIVTDYKTQPNVLPQTGLDEHEQGTFYCWLVSKFYPQIEEFVFRIWYLRYGFYAETRRTREQLETFQQSLLIRRNRISRITSWDPIPGDHCGFCDHVETCPLALDNRPTVREIITSAQAQHAAAELRVKEEWVRRTREKLKVYVEHNDTVELDDYAYGFKSTPSAEWDKGELEEAIRSAGLSAADYFHPDSRAMKRLEKQAERMGGELVERLRAARTLTTKTQFTGYSLTGEDSEEAT